MDRVTFRRSKGRWILSDREEALAFIPASSVGDMCKALLSEMEAIPYTELLTTTHDSFTLACDSSAIEVITVAGRRLMERRWPELGARDAKNFWGRVEIETGRNWGKVSASNSGGLRAL